VTISPAVLIPRGTREDTQRLRLYPIGHNEIGPFDLVFEKTLAVGRSPESEICISNDAQVSANHCALSPQGKSILVQDSGSRNGTRVNGVPINGSLHAEPDSILGVGRTELRMKLLPVGAR
jgi:pSer/pThr/pTyr-binding forkhead associated (FHA) protein